jgi:antitoxin VapB
MITATVTTQGNGQIVHLPADVRIEGDEVFVKQVGKTVVLMPKDMNPWQLMIDSLDKFSDDFMDDRAQPEQQEREPLFD